MKSIVALVVLAFAVQVLGDCYLHNARGSNNRLDEANRDRANANRIFDSQNNNRGGSNVGSVYHYAGSILSLEWTVQHSCGTPNTACEMVIQYMCDPRLRDGTTTNTIPDNRNECYNFDCDTDVRFGRHESYQWYQLCKQTSRNQGLYTANQGLNGNSAIYTRQNPNGDRRGYECPEERDYYPYWRPSPWVDIAVLTDEGRRCAAYQAESQNVKSRWSCVPPAGWVADKLANGQRGFIPITQAACEAITYTPQGSNIPQTGTWTETLPWGVAAPDCRENQPTRDNHHGNTLGGQPAGYNVTIPADFISEQCALRVRYNISTGETSNWASPFSVQAGTDNRTTSYLPSQNNNQNNPGRFPAKTAIWEQYRLSYADVADCFDNNKNGNQATLTNCREYVFKNNPKPDIFGDSLLPAATVKLQLAINTNQFGRTFQDRTHKFAIRARPAGVTGNIYNVNVIGKRGNIVQTYPGHEYYFKPEQLMIKRGDIVHFQWTGSNTNPDNNAGQGKQGTDRHNVISQRGPTYYIPAQLYEGPATATQPIGIYAQNTAIPTYGHYARNYPGKVNDANIGFLGFSQQDRETLAILYDKTTGNGQFGGEKSELDDAGTYFDMGPRVVTQNGNYHYMCTRNNNFSNRGQKAVIVVSDTEGAYAHFGFNEAASTVGGTTVWAATGTFNNLQTFSIVESPRDGSSLDSDTAASPLVYVAPAFLKQNGANTDYSFGTVAGQSVSIMISYDAKAGTPWYKPQAYTTKTPQGAWYTVDADFSNGVATIQATEGGYFAIQNQPNYAALVLIPIAIVIGVVVLAFLFWKFYGAKHCGDRCSSVGSSTITTTKDGPRRANV